MDQEISSLLIGLIKLERHKEGQEITKTKRTKSDDGLGFPILPDTITGGHI